MRTLQLVESVPSLLDLTAEEAKSLQAAGRRLASATTYWAEPDDDTESRSIVTCDPAGPRWRVRIANAVGVIALGDLQLEILPKIPTPHLIYLLSHTSVFPRLSPEAALAIRGETLIEIVARWFNTELQRVLRADPIKDYRPVRDDLKAQRGRVLALPTARNYYAGRPLLTCEFEEFDTDTPINRVLKAAAEAIARTSVFHHDTRRLSRKLSRHLDNVGALRPGDRTAFPDSRMRHYADAHTLALQILRGEGLLPTRGPHLARTFLLYTPSLVEDAIRSILAEALAPDHTVTKRGIGIRGTRLRLQPDLVFDKGAVVGDIKYKIYGPDIKRADLYQAVTFAAGYQTTQALLVSFSDKRRVELLPVGDIELTHITWPTRDEPTQSAQALIERVSKLVRP